MSATKFYMLQGHGVLECIPDGSKLRSYRDAVEIIGVAFENRAKWIVIPVECLHEDFFRLRTLVAGELVQKFVSYRRHLAIVGDISERLDRSPTLRAFVSESNRGNQVWFVASAAEFGRRLARTL